MFGWMVRRLALEHRRDPVAGAPGGIFSRAAISSMEMAGDEPRASRSIIFRLLERFFALRRRPGSGCGFEHRRFSLTRKSRYHKSDISEGICYGEPPRPKTPPFRKRTISRACAGRSPPDRPARGPGSRHRRPARLPLRLLHHRPIAIGRSDE